MTAAGRIPIPSRWTRCAAGATDGQAPAHRRAAWSDSSDPGCAGAAVGPGSGPGRVRNTYTREVQILAHLAALAILLDAGKAGDVSAVSTTAPPTQRT
jgi:hypothetical protein